MSSLSRIIKSNPVFENHQEPIINIHNSFKPVFSTDAIVPSQPIRDVVDLTDHESAPLTSPPPSPCDIVAKRMQADKQRAFDQVLEEMTSPNLTLSSEARFQSYLKKCAEMEQTYRVISFVKDCEAARSQSPNDQLMAKLVKDVFLKEHTPTTKEEFDGKTCAKLRTVFHQLISVSPQTQTMSSNSESLPPEPLPKAVSKSPAPTNSKKRKEPSPSTENSVPTKKLDPITAAAIEAFQTNDLKTYLPKFKALSSERQKEVRKQIRCVSFILTYELNNKAIVNEKVMKTLSKICPCSNARMKETYEAVKNLPFNPAEYTFDIKHLKLSKLLKLPITTLENFEATFKIAKS